MRHEFLWESLRTLGFPETFISTIQHLYDDAKTAVILNGEVGRKFRVTRGVRQGDPVSCLLFDIAIESLAEMIRQSGLVGLDYEGANRRVLSNLFADDTTTFLHNGFLLRSCTMRLPTFPVAPSTIAEYCAFDSFAVNAIITSHAGETNDHASLEASKILFVGGFLHVIFTFRDCETH